MKGCMATIALNWIGWLVGGYSGFKQSPDILTGFSQPKKINEWDLVGWIGIGIVLGLSFEQDSKPLLADDSSRGFAIQYIGDLRL